MSRSSSKLSDVAKTTDCDLRDILNAKRQKTNSRSRSRSPLARSDSLSSLSSLSSDGDVVYEFINERPASPMSLEEDAKRRQEEENRRQEDIKRQEEEQRLIAECFDELEEIEELVLPEDKAEALSDKSSLPSVEAKKPDDCESVSSVELNDALDEQSLSSISDSENVPESSSAEQVWKKSCFVCKSLEHMAKQCPDLKCFKCNQFGHFARECKSVPVQDNPSLVNQLNSSSAHSERTEQIEENDDILQFFGESLASKGNRGVTPLDMFKTWQLCGHGSKSLKTLARGTNCDSDVALRLSLVRELGRVPAGQIPLHLNISDLLDDTIAFLSTHRATTSYEYDAKRSWETFP